MALLRSITGCFDFFALQKRKLKINATTLLLRRLPSSWPSLKFYLIEFDHEP